MWVRVEKNFKFLSVQYRELKFSLTFIRKHFQHFLQFNAHTSKENKTVADRKEPYDNLIFSFSRYITIKKQPRFSY